MLHIGITGGIATGKSTVLQFFLKKGIKLINLDLLAHKLQLPGTKTWHKIIHCFGKTIINNRQEINRDKLAKIIFNKKEKRHLLNSIMHPAIKKYWLEKIKKNSQKIIVSEIPLLFEVGWHKYVDLTILVYVSNQIQIERLILRNKINFAQANLIIKNQMPMVNKMKMANFILNNEKSISDLKKNFDFLWKIIFKKY